MAQDKIDLRKETMSRTDVECGFVVCTNAQGQTHKGVRTCGHRYGVKVETECPSGYTASLIYHTHPGGHAEPSSVDIREAKRLGIARLCIGVPQTGEVKCHDTRNYGKR